MVLFANKSKHYLRNKENNILISIYSPTCIKQAPKGQSKCACLRQVLA